MEITPSRLEPGESTTIHVTIDYARRLRVGDATVLFRTSPDSGLHFIRLTAEVQGNTIQSIPDQIPLRWSASGESGRLAVRTYVAN